MRPTRRQKPLNIYCTKHALHVCACRVERASGWLSRTACVPMCPHVSIDICTSRACSGCVGTRAEGPWPRAAVSRRCVRAGHAATTVTTPTVVVTADTGAAPSAEGRAPRWGGRVRKVVVVGSHSQHDDRDGDRRGDHGGDLDNEADATPKTTKYLLFVTADTAPPARRPRRGAPPARDKVRCRWAGGSKHRHHVRGQHAEVSTGCR